MTPVRPLWVWPPDNRLAAETPDLVALRETARLLPQRRGHSGGQQGAHLSRLRGRGMEFAETRPYQAGDDVRHIDWRVTARSTQVHTKLFQEERERPVLLWVDYREAMHFATRGVFKSVLAARAAAVLAWHSALRGDRAGGLIFSQARESVLRPRRGPRAALHLARQLATADWRKPAARDPIQPLATLQSLQRMARPGSVVALLSDFRGIDEQHFEPLHRIARHCALLLLHIYDPLEAELPPPGVYPVFSNGSRWLLDSRDPAARHAHRAEFESRRHGLRELGRSTGALLLDCPTDRDPLPLLRQACAGSNR